MLNVGCAKEGLSLNVIKFIQTSIRILEYKVFIWPWNGCKLIYCSEVLSNEYFICVCHSVVEEYMKIVYCGAWKF
jgi:hypothetical protein